MAGDAGNLLTRDPMTVADLEMQLYAVLDKKDYRVKLQTLLEILTPMMIGLGNVDNTSDLNKPIPNKVQEALDKKADTGLYVTQETFDQFASSVESMLDISQLNLAIQNILQQLETKQSAQQVQTAINEALAPIIQAANETASQLSNFESKFSNYVLKSDYDLALQGFSQTIGGLLTEFTANQQSYEARFASIENRVTDLENRKQDLVIGATEW